MNVEIKDLIKELVNKKIFILKLSILLIFFSFINVAFFYQHEYTSASKVYLSDKSSSQLSLGGLSQFGLQVPFSQGSATSKLSILNELVGSYSFLDSILKEEVAVDDEKYDTIYSYLNTDNKPDSHQLKIDLVQSLQKKISVVENYQSSLIKISTTDKNRYFAKSLNEVIIKNSNKILSDLDNKIALEKLEFINNRIKDVNKDLLKAENDLMLFKSQNKQINSSIALQLELDKLSRNVSFQTNIMTTLLEQKEVAKIQNIEDARSFNVLEPPVLPFYASTTRRLYMLIIYSVISLLIPVFIITLNIFYRNLSRKINQFF